MPSTAMALLSGFCTVFSLQNDFTNISLLLKLADLFGGVRHVCIHSSWELCHGTHYTDSPHNCSTEGVLNLTRHYAQCIILL